MNRKMFSRVVALILAVIMFGSVFAVVFQAFAFGPEVAAIANTGDSDVKRLIIVVAVVAVVIILVLIAWPIFKKKRQ